MNWFEILKGLYERKKIGIDKLDSSVAKGLITEEQMELILYPPTSDPAQTDNI